MPIVTVKDGELSYMALAMEREHTAYRSVLMVAGAVLADPEPMLARLVRGCIAAFGRGLLKRSHASGILGIRQRRR